jgi:predicted ribonuclease toxin of YeeF-YezG toxin-antitoxin module
VGLERNWQPTPFIITATEVANLGWITVNVQATNARQYNAQIQVQAYDPYDVVRLGVTALPNVATGNAGAVATGDASGRVTVITNSDKLDTR